MNDAETNSEMDLYKPFSSLRLFLTGAAMGIADLIPGVSGGTIAFILGIYDALLSAIKSVNAHFFRALLTFKLKEAFSLIPWRFCIALGSGIGVAIFGMASTMKYLLENEPALLFAFFFGLVLASIITVSSTLKWNFAAVISLVLGAIAGYLIVGAVPSEMPHTPFNLFWSGAVAVMAMILPGISGSFILLVLGQYEYVLGAVTSFDIITILPLIVGIVLGIMWFSRVLSWTLKHYHVVTVAALVGFMVGSLRKIWPWKEVVETMTNEQGELVVLRESNILPASFSSPEFYYALALAVFGFVLLVVIDRLAKKE